MKLINSDKYKKDIEHYRNTICYQRNVTMDDCMRILDKQEDVLGKIRAEIEQLPTKTRTNWNGCCPDIDYPQIEYVDVTKNKLLSIIDHYKEKSEE